MGWSMQHAWIQMKLPLCVTNSPSTKTYILVKVNIQLFLTSHWLKVGCQLHSLSIFTPERIFLYFLWNIRQVLKLPRRNGEKKSHFICRKLNWSTRQPQPSRCKAHKTEEKCINNVQAKAGKHEDQWAKHKDDIKMVPKETVCVEM